MILSGMNVARFIYGALYLAPVGLVLSIGADSRTYTDPYEPVAYSPHQRAVVNKLAALSQRTDAIAYGPKRDYSKMAALLADWNAALSPENIRDLRPIAPDDTTVDGPKGRIVESFMVLADQVYLFGSVGQPPAVAAQKYLDYVRDMSRIKGIDISAYGRGARQQAIAIHRLRNLSGIPAEKWPGIRSELVAIEQAGFSSEPLKRMNDRLFGASAHPAVGASHDVAAKPGPDETKVNAKVEPRTSSLGHNLLNDPEVARTNERRYRTILAQAIEHFSHTPAP